MQSMKTTASNINEIVMDLSKKILFNHMSNITIINSTDFFISFSNYRKEKLIVSLNPNDPFLSLAEINSPCGTKISSLNDILRKEVKDGLITKVETVNNDRVVSIHFSFTNDYFEKETREMVIELIPHRPNVLILDEDKTILFANHYTDIANEHPIIKGLKYQLMENKNSYEKEPFDIDMYRKMAAEYYFIATRKRLEEKFKPVLQHIKSRIKSLKQKLIILDKEIAQATIDLNNKEKGQSILSYSYSEEELKNYIREDNIDYDFSLTPGVNAERYFKKYKKAKRTIEMAQKEKEKTADEIKYLEVCLSQTKYMNEDDIMELANLLFPKKYKIGSKTKLQSKPSEIVVDGVRIIYGKNAKQNNELTFQKAQRNQWFFHVKDTHGSHVIVFDDNPSKEIILTACEVALLLNGKDSGDVQSTQIKNVKKGSYMGQALLSSYITYTINGVRQSTIDYLKK